MTDDLPTYARALQSRKKKSNQFNLMDDNYDEACFYSSQSRNYNYNYKDKQVYDTEIQNKQPYQNYENQQNRRNQRSDYEYNQNVDYNYYDFNQNKERGTHHSRKRRSQPTYIQNNQPNQQQIMQQQSSFQQQNFQQQQPLYNQQYPPQTQKNQTHRKRSFPTDKMEEIFPDQQSIGDDIYSQKPAKAVQPAKENAFSDPKVISELQQKNRELINEIRALKTSRNDDEINELRAALQTQKNRNAQLFQDLQNSENQVADTKQLLALKDTTIQNLQDECQKLRIEYQDLLASIRIQNDQIAQLNRRNRELELEIEKTKLNQQCFNLYPSIPFTQIQQQQQQQQRYIDNNINNNNNVQQNKIIQDQNTVQIEQTTQLNSQSNKNNVHPAMRDNLFFEETPKKADEINAKSLTDDELREKYKTYTQLKESKNWILSRAPPKGSNFCHVRQEKEKLADECDELARICSKIKLEMKLRGIF